MPVASPLAMDFEDHDLETSHDLPAFPPEASRDPKRRGEIAELAFMHKARTLGFAVAKPYGDSEYYDFLLDVRSSDSHAHLWRVQVKSTIEFRQYRYFVNTAHSFTRSRQRCYQPDQIDVVAAYIVPLQVWYVIPIGVLGSRQKIALYPNKKNSRGQFERYREAWELMSGIGPAEPA
jgi:hypothetical protein